MTRLWLTLACVLVAVAVVSAQSVRPGVVKAARVAASTTNYVYHVVTILDDDEIKSLPTIAVDVAPAPGVGRMLIFERAITSGVTYGPYTNISADAYGGFGFGVDDVYLSAIAANDAGSANTSMTSFLNAGDGSDRFVTWWEPLSHTMLPWFNTIAVRLRSHVENKPILLWIANAAGDFTDGDPTNTITVTVEYKVIDLTTGLLVPAP